MAINNQGLSRFNAALHELGRTLGIPDLAADENGTCALKYGDQEVIVQRDQDCNHATVFTVLGELPENVSRRCLQSLLTANLFWDKTEGSTLSIDPDSNGLVLARLLDLPRLEPEEGPERISEFVETAYAWKEIYPDLLSNEEGGAAQPPAAFAGVDIRNFG